MTQARYYSSNAVSTTLTGGVSSGATTLPVAATTGFPVSLPFTLILERDTANEEVVTVTGVSSLNLTVTRGVDGTAAVSHSVGATVQHGVSARDFSEPQAHIGASSGVHGLAGAVVGTTDVQTLTNKAMNGAVLDAASTLGGVSGTTLAAERSAWATYTPNWSGTTAAPLSTNVGHYRQVGKFVVAQATLIASGSATAGVFLSNAPVTLAGGPALQSPLGTFAWFVAATGVTRTGTVWNYNNSALIQFKLDNTTGYVTAAIASGDSLSFNLSYEST